MKSIVVLILILSTVFSCKKGDLDSTKTKFLDTPIAYIPDIPHSIIGHENGSDSTNCITVLTNDSGEVNVENPDFAFTACKYPLSESDHTYRKMDSISESYKALADDIEFLKANHFGIYFDSSIAFRCNLKNDNEKWVVITLHNIHRVNNYFVKTYLNYGVGGPENAAVQQYQKYMKMIRFKD